MQLTCLISSTMACWVLTFNSFIRTIKICLLGHWTAAPSNNVINNFICSKPARDSKRNRSEQSNPESSEQKASNQPTLPGLCPKMEQSGKTRTVWFSSSSYRVFKFFTIISKFLARAFAAVRSSTFSNFVGWFCGSGSICSQTECKIVPSNSDWYPVKISGRGRQDSSWKCLKPSQWIYSKD